MLYFSRGDLVKNVGAIFDHDRSRAASSNFFPKCGLPDNAIRAPQVD
jgi:hypothetical protein